MRRTGRNGRWSTCCRPSPAATPAGGRSTPPQGPAEIRILADAATGVVDHEFRDPDDPEEVATVPARVVANGRGAEFLMTVFQPSEVADADFDQVLAAVTTEFATLKDVLERRGD